jgi:hypothetical protein
MRVPLAMFALTLSVPALAAEPSPDTKAPRAPARACRQTKPYFAGANSIYRGQPLRPRKLTELPPGTAFMAVYRRIDGCEAPLTMVDYRSPKRR